MQELFHLTRQILESERADVLLWTSSIRSSVDIEYDIIVPCVNVNETKEPL